MARFCTRFYCDKRGDRFCCADCSDRKACAHPCLNHPSRCRLADYGGKPIKRRGGKGYVPPRKKPGGER